MNSQQIFLRPKLPCVYCGKNFKSAKTHATHIRKYHCMDLVRPTAANAATHHCQQRRKTYRRKAALCRHSFAYISASADDAATLALFRCDAPLCSKGFRSQKRLSEHKRRTHSIATQQLICEFCGYRTRFRCNLVVHRRTHTGELPFCCDRCGKCFAALYQLVEHGHTHVRRRSHHCDICGVAFLRPKALHHHCALHLAQKKFECRVCGKSYAQAAGLSQHMRRHREIVATKIVLEVMAVNKTDI